MQIQNRIFFAISLIAVVFVVAIIGIYFNEGVPEGAIAVGEKKTITTEFGKSITLEFVKLSNPEHDFKGLLSITSTIPPFTDSEGDILFPSPVEEVWLSTGANWQVDWLDNEAKLHLINVTHNVSRGGDHYFEYEIGTSE